MDQKTFTYPRFEPNQVLTHNQLNTVVEYLGEQERLTRANLIGRGIVCGLKEKSQTVGGVTTITVERGCAVTSEGYLIVEPHDVTYTHYRPFTLESSDAYENFMSDGSQISIYELVSGNPRDTDIALASGMLTNNLLVLYVELSTTNLSDCSPNNCDDRGSDVTMSIRRLLVPQNHKGKLYGKTEADADKSRTDRETLPEIRLSTCRLRNENTKTTVDVRKYFSSMYEQSSQKEFSKLILGALKKVYSGFKPFLMPSDIDVSTLSVKMAGIDPMFIQYSVDHLHDIIRSYEELRAYGSVNECGCMPDARSFPRHVVIGAGVRHAWTPAATSCHRCDESRAVIRLLYRRLVALITRYVEPNKHRNIRVTPSSAGKASLSERAIPFYYSHASNPELHTLWNAHRTMRGEADNNLGYHYQGDESKPAFVKAPLEYDLEPYDFYRIEGHIGHHYKKALEELTQLQKQHGLGFDVVAVHTGEAESPSKADIGEHQCQLRDLDALYSVLRTELLCIAKTAKQNIGKLSSPEIEAIIAKESYAKKALDTGAHIATKHDNGTVHELYQLRTAEKSDCEGIQVLGASTIVNAHLLGMSRIEMLAKTMPPDLAAMDYQAVADAHSNLNRTSEELIRLHESGDAKEPEWKKLNDQLLSLVTDCKMKALKDLRDRFEARVAEIARMRTLEYYQSKHPSLVHGAGVPVGGTFVLVYHNAGTNNAPVDIKDGTVVADFYLPYRCCSDCTPIQFVVHADPSVVPKSIEASVSVGCTTEKGAQIEVTVRNGTEPYKMELDGKSTDHPAQFFLMPGKHTLVVVDGTGMKSSAISIDIPEPLTISEVKYAVAARASTYRASFSVVGGIGPYSIEVDSDVAATIKDGAVEVGPIKSGSMVTITISDSKGCKQEVKITKTIEQPCDKPCKGLAVRDRCPLWIPRPKGTMIYTPIKGNQLELVTDSGTQRLPLDEIVGSVIGNSGVTSADYDDKMKRLCAAITEAVTKTLGPDSFGISFEPGETPTILIERYECHSFTLATAYSTPWSGIPSGFAIVRAYHNAGVALRNGASAQPSAPLVDIPKFGGSRLDKCKSVSLSEECRLSGFKVTSKSADKDLIIQLQVPQTLDPNSLSYQWAFMGLEPSFSKEKTFKIPAKVPGVVHVLVTDAKGCWWYQEFWSANPPQQR
ncbi:MAG: hypothetical protein FGM33_04125 [Candidatus Kapabacteria bacterium]|nr:hypothetical protein [Candidatus Kapabacteria bacterium]